jgi:hypothetical protein
MPQRRGFAASQQLSARWKRLRSAPLLQAQNFFLQGRRMKIERLQKEAARLGKRQCMKLPPKVSPP